jgi:hypothetical protein
MGEEEITIVVRSGGEDFAVALAANLDCAKIKISTRNRRHGRDI